MRRHPIYNFHPPLNLLLSSLPSLPGSAVLQLGRLGRQHSWSVWPWYLCALVSTLQLWKAWTKPVPGQQLGPNSAKWGVWSFVFGKSLQIVFSNSRLLVPLCPVSVAIKIRSASVVCLVSETEHQILLNHCDSGWPPRIGLLMWQA